MLVIAAALLSGCSNSPAKSDTESTPAPRIEPSPPLVVLNADTPEERAVLADPFIGITTKKLGEDFFWQNHNQVSVISTYGWRDLAPPSAYEFIVYSIIVNSIVIHLNTYCDGLPEGSFKGSRVSHGDLFQFSPDRAEIKAAILSAHLSQRGEELLFNCFGAEYMNICSDLLSLEWLHSKKVTDNLKKAFVINPNQ